MLTTSQCTLFHIISKNLKFKSPKNIDEIQKKIDQKNISNLPWVFFFTLFLLLGGLNCVVAHCSEAFLRSEELGYQKKLG